MFKVVHCRDVIVMNLKLDIWIDLSQCSLGGLHFTQTWLVGFEEQAIHVGQLDFVIVKEDQLVMEWEWRIRVWWHDNGNEELYCDRTT